MKIRYPIIASIIIFITGTIIGEIFGEGILTEIMLTLWGINALWFICTVIATICRAIYRAVKNRANRPEKSPLEP